ncbi:MAG: hypothetical protein DCC75_06055 [Proteobacteria bacterium]|nr:MAG: hypothetical protein DCC75_06055 [Pseudomonadota bacterium]
MTVDLGGVINSWLERGSYPNLLGIFLSALLAITLGVVSISILWPNAIWRLNSGPEDLLTSIPGVAIQYYQVSGSTYEELSGSLRQNAIIARTGTLHTAKVDWKINWKFEKDEDGKYDFHNPKLSYEMVVTLPSWSPPPGVDPQLVERWDRLLKALITHEHGHVNNFIDAYNRISYSVKRVAKRKPNLTLEEANKLASSILSQVKIRDRYYDKVTKHGQTQGVAW